MREMGLKQLVTNIGGTGNMTQVTSWIIGAAAERQEGTFHKL